VVDTALGTSSSQSGFNPATGDINIGVALPVSPVSFKLLSDSEVIRTIPVSALADYPTVDFYGNQITAPASPGAAQEVIVAVSATGVTLNKKSLDILIGDSEILLPTVLPANTENKVVTWNSNTPSVATVDTVGRVTAVGTGTAIITVTTVSGGFQDSCEVNASRLLNMVWVAGGYFNMGSSAADADTSEQPVHQVTLSGFYMGVYQITQEQYNVIMGSNPANFASAGSLSPVEQVSWYDALVFCNRLSIKEGLTPAYNISGNTNPDYWGTVPATDSPGWNAVVLVSDSNGYRLPTEAQWEYAAKGGSGSPGNFVFAGSNDHNTVAWYSGNSENKTRAVGGKSPNNLGIYDMSGNVWEWCWDRYGVYTSNAATDPDGASTGIFRVVRGGSWGSDRQNLRSSSRNVEIPSYRHSDLGFRVVRP